MTQPIRTFVIVDAGKKVQRLLVLV